MSSTPEKSRGFTLIEVLVVITVIAILASIVTPMVFRNVGDAKCLPPAPRSRSSGLRSTPTGWTPTTTRPRPGIGGAAASSRREPLPRATGAGPTSRRAYRSIPTAGLRLPEPRRSKPQRYDLKSLGRDGEPGGTGEEGTSPPGAGRPSDGGISLSRGQDRRVAAHRPHRGRESRAGWHAAGGARSSPDHGRAVRRRRVAPARGRPARAGGGVPRHCRTHRGGRAAGGGRRRCRAAGGRGVARLPRRSRTQLRRGQGLAEALDGSDGTVPSVVLGMLRAGDRAGGSAPRWSRWPPTSSSRPTSRAGSARAGLPGGPRGRRVRVGVDHRDGGGAQVRRADRRHGAEVLLATAPCSP